MSNITTGAVNMEEEMHWVFATLSHFLLILALVGTFTRILIRTLDPKHRAELKRNSGLDNASSLLGREDVGSVTGTFRDARTDAKAEKQTAGLSGGPDVKNSCAVMQCIGVCNIL